MLEDHRQEGESSCSADIDHYRSRVRAVLDSLVCEIIVISTVVIYAIIIFVDLSISAAAASLDENTVKDEDHEEGWENAFHVLDQIFLTIFLVLGFPSEQAKQTFLLFLFLFSITLLLF